MALSSGVMPLPSASSRFAPRSTSRRATSSWPSRAAYSSAVFAPPAGKRLPRPSGQPARTMPMPLERPGGDSLGGMKRGGSSGVVAASMSAPASSKRRTSATCPSPRRDHQRRLAEACVARVDGGAMLEQRSGDVGVADARRLQQRRLAGAIGARRVRADLEQPARHRGIARRNREMERRDAVAAGGVDVGAGSHQALGRSAIADAHHPVQRGRAVAARRVRVGAVVEQGEHGRGVAALRRFRERRSRHVGGRRRE